MVASESMNVSIVEEFGCHKRVEHLLLRRTLGVRLRCMSPFLALSGLADAIFYLSAFGGEADLRDRVA
jgi:hypothetical protein